jgi:hypothetical protein
MEGKMQAVLGTLERYSNREPRISTFGVTVGKWLSEIFGCTHKEMSRPFSRQGESYRVCISCGARRSFDQQLWNSAGPYYYKPATTTDLLETRVSTVKAAKERKLKLVH